jgi:hypothetical protein
MGHEMTGHKRVDGDTAERERPGHRQANHRQGDARGAVDDNAGEREDLASAYVIVQPLRPLSITYIAAVSTNKGMRSSEKPLGRWPVVHEEALVG